MTDVSQPQSSHSAKDTQCKCNEIRMTQELFKLLDSNSAASICAQECVPTDEEARLTMKNIIIIIK